MTPQTVNAYYGATRNEIVFPAAMLAPPFFDERADDAVSYGAIGAVIGHELSHGFDDQGRKSDAHGNLRDWWTPADAERLARRTERVVRQYSGYSPLAGRHVDGQLTLGENIADLAGVRIALDAYLLSLGGQPAPVIDGYGGEQRFFFGWAQIWRRKYRDAELDRRLRTDPHAPSEYRVNGVLPHLDEFHAAFGVAPGSGMWRPPEERDTIW
jgi:predicted metalloendopeptidase